MRQGQKFQTRVRHQRSVGRYKSPYQRGGTIVSPPFNPWAPHTFDKRWLQRRMLQRGGKVHKVIYPWQNKARKRIKRQRKRR